MSAESSAAIIRKMMSLEQKAEEAVRRLKALDATSGARARICIQVQVVGSRARAREIYAEERAIMKDFGGAWDFSLLYDDEGA